ncbi:MAG: UDP-N-acetylglucosamine 2-epimerase (non-hydrolyzing) [Candidatus Paracaedimonas acanthamoebae]|uniref:UDP-N-acetylglucosamine 2-epimerase (Non-hydrolyzing) n=1 Tax=Candidatus Paracaedimonas acanthamoebae TaxID=244581 RepID=A0A8J7TV38_9PROT|nr:UDP-N-acetylglucosamine 2-epimerase (non-hydrolyzing) [Candidatus Paracaedimonas acanthamoebae]
MKKILTIIGARPQFIKATALSRAISKEHNLSEIVVHTGQHYDKNMSDIFFEDLEMSPPAYQLKLQGTQHGHMTAEMIIEIEKIILREKPDLMVIYGDTNSTLAGAIAASKLELPIAHIESGLRSFLKHQPEEINRRVSDHLSTYLFCPTQKAVDNLSNEGISKGVYHVGDVMYDVSLLAKEKSKINSTIINDLGLKFKEYQIATIHRAENTDSEEALLKVITYLKERAEDHPLIFPIHPRTQKAISRLSLDLGKIVVIPPLGYFDMAQLLSGATCAYTDSGGLQKEAYFLSVPCVTLREVTEWEETIDCGWNRLWHVEQYKERQTITDYGIGNAAEKIVSLFK